MRIKQIFALVFGAMAVAVAASIGVGLALNSQLEILEQVGKRRYLSYQKAEELRHSSDDLTRFARTYVETGERQYRQMYKDVIAIRNGDKPRPQDYQGIYWDLVTQYGEKPRPDGQREALRDSMQRLGFTDREFALLDKANTLSDQLAQMESKAMAAMDQGQVEAARTLLHGPEYHAQKALIMQPIDEFFRILEARTQAELAAAQERADALALALVVLLILVAALAIAGYLVIGRKVTHPLTTLTGLMQQIETNADLTLRAEARGNDEISQIGRHLNGVSERFFNIISEIVKVADAVTQTASHVRSFTTEASDRTSRQTDETNMVATAINEMSCALEEITRNTNEAAVAASSANDKVSEGNLIVEGSISNMNQLLEQMHNTSDTIDHLAADFKQVESVLDVIKTIAEQTNLLALNAAIEAARAGDQGRGFAVVADEVRTLASRTQTSTEEIESMISRLTQGMGQAVDSIHQGMQRVNQTNESVTETGVVLSQITLSVEAIREMSMQIAAATEEQATAVESVNRSVVSVKDLTDATHNGVQSVAKDTGSLNQQISRLREMIGTFRIR